MAERMANTTTHDQPADDSSFDLSEIDTDKRRPGPGVMRKFMGKSALAAMSMIGPVDYMTSDSKDATIFNSLSETIELDNKTTERALENGTFFVLGVAEIAILGTLIGKSKKARGAFDAYDDYREGREKDRGKVKDIIMRGVEFPFSILERIGHKVEAKREDLENRESVRFRKAKKVALDAGVLNLMGTSTTQLQETMTGKPPSLGRNIYFGALFSGTWLAGAEAVRTLYRGVPSVRAPLATVGRTLDMFTSPTNPVGAATLATFAGFLAYTGWRIESFRQKQADEANAEGEL